MLDALMIVSLLIEYSSKPLRKLIQFSIFVKSVVPE